MSRSIEGSLFEESTMRINEHVIQSIRVYKAVDDFYNFVELNLEVSAGSNTEICMRLDLSSFSRKFQLSTDNGLNQVNRSSYKTSEFLPGNGYPSVSQINLSDEESELTLLTSQSVAVINVGDS